MANQSQTPEEMSTTIPETVEATVEATVNTIVEATVEAIVEEINQATQDLKNMTQKNTSNVENTITESEIKNKFTFETNLEMPNKEAMIKASVQNLLERVINDMERCVKYGDFHTNTFYAPKDQRIRKQIEEFLNKYDFKIEYVYSDKCFRVHWD